MTRGIIRTLKIPSWMVVLTGIACTIRGLNVPAMHHHAAEGHVCFWLLFHRISGLIIIAIMLWHIYKHHRWYAAWAKGKFVTPSPSMRLTRWTSIAFLSVAAVLLLKQFMPWGLFAWLHIMTALLMVVLSVRHCKSRVRRGHRQRKRRYQTEQDCQTNKH